MTHEGMPGIKFRCGWEGCDFSSLRKDDWRRHADDQHLVLDRDTGSDSCDGATFSNGSCRDVGIVVKAEG